MHARVYVGPYEDVYPYLPDAVRSGGPDVFIERGDLLKADPARALRARAAQNPVAGGELHIVLAYARMMPEAQNVLLKEFEEPRRAIWHVIVPHADMLLPTVRSRLVHMHTAPLHESPDESVREFFASTYSERLALIARIFEKAKKSDEEKERVHAWAIEVIEECERIAHRDPVRHAALLRDILLVRTYIDRPGASGKMLLELLALDL